MGVGKERLDGVLVRHQFDQQTRRTDHRQYGLRLAAADDHAGLDQSAAHDWHSVRNEVLKSAPATKPRESTCIGGHRPPIFVEWRKGEREGSHVTDNSAQTDRSGRRAAARLGLRVALRPHDVEVGELLARASPTCRRWSASTPCSRPPSSRAVRRCGGTISSSAWGSYGVSRLRRDRLAVSDFRRSVSLGAPPRGQALGLDGRLGVRLGTVLHDGGRRHRRRAVSRAVVRAREHAGRDHRDRAHAHRHAPRCSI